MSTEIQLFYFCMNMYECDVCVVRLVLPWQYMCLCMPTVEIVMSPCNDCFLFLLRLRLLAGVAYQCHCLFLDALRVSSVLSRPFLLDAVCVCIYWRECAKLIVVIGVGLIAIIDSLSCVISPTVCI